MAKRNSPRRPRTEALRWALADQGVTAVALAFCTWLAAHELDPAYRTWGLAVASLVGMVVVLRTLAICYRLYQAKDEPPVTNIAPAYRNAPLPDNRCPVCGRRLSADKHATLHCPGSRCGYRWPQ